LLDVQQAIWSLNASLPLAHVRTRQEMYDKSRARTSFTLVLLAGSITLLIGLKLAMGRAATE
jgi:hypothetical protein